MEFCSHDATTGMEGVKSLSLWSLGHLQWIAVPGSWETHWFLWAVFSICCVCNILVCIVIVYYSTHFLFVTEIVWSICWQSGLIRGPNSLFVCRKVCIIHSKTWPSGGRVSIKDRSEQLFHKIVNSIVMLLLHNVSFWCSLMYIVFVSAARYSKGRNDRVGLNMLNMSSDHTFYTQSQIMVEKFLNFWQNLSAFVMFVREWPPHGEGREILLKIRELFHHNLTLCVECGIRNYVSRVQKHSFPPKKC